MLAVFSSIISILWLLEAVKAVIEFTEAPYALPSAMYDFGYGYYDNALYIFNGDDLNSYRLQFSSAPNVTTGVWHASGIGIPFEDVTRVAFYRVTIQVGSLVYCPMPVLSLSHPFCWQSLLIFDLQSRQYKDTTTYASVAPQEMRFSCSVYNSARNCLYVFGAVDAPKMALKYSIGGDSWSYLANLTVGRVHSGCAMYEATQTAFLVGGQDDYGGEYLDSVEMYDVATDSFALVPATLRYAKRSISCIFWPAVDNIFCVGGYMGVNQLLLKSVMVFDPREHTIDDRNYSLARSGSYGFPYVKWSVGLVVVDNCLLVLGGMGYYPAAAYTDTIEYLCVEMPDSTKTRDLQLSASIVPLLVAIFIFT